MVATWLVRGIEMKFSVEEQAFLDEQAALDDLNTKIIEEQELDKRYHQEMEWAIEEALSDSWDN